MSIAIEIERPKKWDWKLYGKSDQSVEVKESAFMSEMVARREAGETAEAHNRTEAIDNLKFMLGGEYQWPKTMWDLRTAAGLPCLSINDLPKYANQIIGEQLQNRPQVKVKPQDSEADPEMCQYLEDVIRHIEHESQEESLSDEAYKHMVLAGYPSYKRILTQFKDDASFDQKIIIEYIDNQFMVITDPNSVLPDGRDKAWAMILKSYTLAEYKAKYGADKDIPTPAELPEIGTQYTQWFESDNVIVCEYLFRLKEGEKKIAELSDGQVMDTDKADATIKIAKAAGVVLAVERERTVPVYGLWHSIVSGAEILEGPNRLPGKQGLVPIISIIPPCLMVEGKKYYRSLIQDAKDPARLYNYWTSITTERIIPKPDYILTKEMLQGHEKQWAESMVKRLPYLTVNQTPMGWPQPSQPIQMSTAEVDMRRQAIDDKKATLGIYDQNVGNSPSETSGIAIQARDAQKDTGTYEYFNGLLRAKKLQGDIILDLLPELYPNETKLPTLGFDGNDGRWTVNKRAVGPDGEKTIENDLSTGKYGALITTGPSYATQRMETQDVMVNFAKLFAGTPVLLAIAPILAKNLDIPHADKLSELLKALQPPELRQLYEEPKEGEQQIPPQVKQAFMQLQQTAQEQAQMAQQTIMELQQQLQELKSGAQAKMAEVELKRELSVQEQQIERDRIMQEMTLKEKELAQKEVESKRNFELAMEKLKAETAMKFKMFMQDHMQRNKMEANSKGIKLPEDIKAEKDADAESMKQIMGEFASMMEATIKPLIEGVNAPKEIVRDKDGKIAKVIPIKKGGGKNE